MLTGRPSAQETTLMINGIFSCSWPRLVAARGSLSHDPIPQRVTLSVPVAKRGQRLFPGLVAPADLVAPDLVDAPAEAPRVHEPERARPAPVGKLARLVVVQLDESCLSG